MNTPSAVSTGLGCLLLCAGAISVVPGCADTEPFPDTDGPGVTDGVGPAALPDGGHVLDEYVLQIRPSQHTSKLIHLRPGASRKPGFKAQSVDNLSIVEDGMSGSGPANSIELYTDPNSIISSPGTSCPSGVALSFCGTVKLGSFYTRPLNNVYVQATAITDNNGVAVTGHSSINSDSPPSWLADNGFGLWRHTADLATANSGVIGTSPNNFGSRIWEFADPDGIDTNILLRVVSTLSYKDYSRSSITKAYVNSCTQTNDNSANGNDAAVTIPFPFTFYNLQATQTSIFNRNGVLALGGVTPPSAFDNTTFKSVALPDNTVPHVSSSPGIYAFWDKLNYNASQTGICHGVFGTAPNRTFVYTWRNMKGFSNTANTMVINFNVVLTEGTDTIDMVYGPMSGATGNDMTTFPTAPTTILNTQRAQGKKAIIGVQGPNGSVNISTPTPAALGGTTIALSASNTNTAFRYTPIP
jgi:hypothetical protein